MEFLLKFDHLRVSFFRLLANQLRNLEANIIYHPVGVGLCFKMGLICFYYLLFIECEQMSNKAIFELIRVNTFSRWEKLNDQ